MKSPIYEERLELLGLIAREAAYDAGLWVGHSVGRGEEACVG